MYLIRVTTAQGKKKEIDLLQHYVDEDEVKFDHHLLHHIPFLYSYTTYLRQQIHFLYTLSNLYWTF